MAKQPHQQTNICCLADCCTHGSDSTYANASLTCSIICSLTGWSAPTVQQKSLLFCKVLEILLRADAVVDLNPPKAPDRHRESRSAPMLGWIWGQALRGSRWRQYAAALDQHTFISGDSYSTSRRKELTAACWSEFWGLMAPEAMEMRM